MHMESAASWFTGSRAILVENTSKSQRSGIGITEGGMPPGQRQPTAIRPGAVDPPVDHQPAFHERLKRKGVLPLAALTRQPCTDPTPLR